jgi:hypothetical protein
MILRTIKPEQIVSLRLNTILYSLTSELASLAGLTNVISLSLLNFHCTYLINKYEEYFPELFRLSLWYDNEVNFNILTTILKHILRPIKRLEIHCSGAICTHCHWDPLNTRYANNFTVEYFLIDIGHFPLPSTRECYENHKSCFLITTIDLMKKMPNIRHVRVITNKYNLEELLDANEWKSLKNICFKLKTITLEVLGSMIEKEELLQKAMEIQKIFQDDQQTIKFKIVFM